METTEIAAIRSLVSYFIKHKNLWVDYDELADVLYVHFKKPNRADNTVMEDENLLIRYENDEMVGITLMHASKGKG
ncbi:MAG: DUF2283 domain-containing protein [Clostridia bacterium]|jgi:uncharacterized protein YuzE|nr:DUF2283 domain-containing protein [Salinivirgaceae bacterium]NCB43600.1 DUF2283 domain-containing protein [Clostridia bacterium]